MRDRVQQEGLGIRFLCNDANHAMAPLWGVALINWAKWTLNYLFRIGVVYGEQGLGGLWTHWGSHWWLLPLICGVSTIRIHMIVYFIIEFTAFIYYFIINLFIILLFNLQLFWRPASFSSTEQTEVTQEWLCWFGSVLGFFVISDLAFFFFLFFSCHWKQQLRVFSSSSFSSEC